MTYDYGEGAPPRGQGQFWDQRNDPADVEAAPPSNAWPQQPSYEPHPQRAGEGQYGSRPYPAGYGEPRTPQGGQAHPATGFRTPRQHPAVRGDAAQRTGPYRSGEHRTLNQHGNAGPYGTPGDHDVPGQYGRYPSQSGTAAMYDGQYDEPAAGPNRGAEQYGAAHYQSQATFDEPRRADAGPKAARRSRKPLVFTIILVILVIGGGAGWYYLRGSANLPPTEQERRVADQTVDPAPLTATEVFGSATIPAATGDGAYKVLKTQASADCDTAAGGAIVKALTTAGCTQVVRATLMSPDGALVITAGIFNLETDEKAAKASAEIKTAVDAGKGRFSGMVAGGTSNLIDRAAANLAWDARGHYLMYCLIANADGSAIAADDPHTQQVRDDLVERYLGDVVIHKREAPDGPAVVPSTQSS
ncbi:hypothetical protein AB0C02_05980 [Micromonospora sp. NPDC048999]|uniref:hypothetical protein n=1 Tax=Micromonospora sp. NPDC048999 TaxID=3155391 RepID=UPI0033C41237